MRLVTLSVVFLFWSPEKPHSFYLLRLISIPFGNFDSGQFTFHRIFSRYLDVHWSSCRLADLFPPLDPYFRGIEGSSGPSRAGVPFAHPQNGSEEALPRHRAPSAPTRTAATDEGSWNAHSGPSAWKEPRKSLWRFLRALGSFIDVAKQKCVKASL